ncbi:hypothetical protein [Streptomyces sp. NPDC053720]|uniref:hypothetical protein n=1 Tax=Streptomyces sp. NPDC053720 TaxID=3154855 RepID=UPI00342EABB8
MQTIGGRQWANREDLAEHSRFTRRTLSSLWRNRETNNHPPARTIDGVMHWDLAQWTAWFTEYRKRDTSGVDRSGNPDEELPPAEQARLLGIATSRISQYQKNPPPGWPSPSRTEELPTRTREYRTRRQLWAFADADRRGRRTAKKEKEPDPRLQQAAEALAAQPGRKPGEVADALAREHGQSVHTWKRIITQVRRKQ